MSPKCMPPQPHQGTYSHSGTHGLGKRPAERHITPGPFYLALAMVYALALASCAPSADLGDNVLVAVTAQIGDALERVAGPDSPFDTVTLMGPGDDPHSYNATSREV